MKPSRPLRLWHDGRRSVVLGPAHFFFKSALDRLESCVIVPSPFETACVSGFGQRSLEAGDLACHINKARWKVPESGVLASPNGLFFDKLTV